MASIIVTNPYSICQKGWITIGEKRIYVKSLWEGNIAAYYQFLKSINEIQEWEYEPDTFWFEKIKRGVRSYLPDFKITDKEGKTYYTEVKGWMDSKSKTKLKRMAKYYPEVKIDLIDQKRYTHINNNMKDIIPNWDLLKTQKI